MADLQHPIEQRVEATNGGTIQNVTQVYAEHLHLRSSHLSDEQLAALRRGYNIPLLPDYYIVREEYLDSLRRTLLMEGTFALGIVGVRGMGGIGKSVLAAALARDQNIQSAFPDGIIWLPIGREPNLPARQEELFLLLTGQRETFRDEIQGHGILSVALAQKACLVVLDDVWDVYQAEVFPLQSVSQTRYLITTRNTEILQSLSAQIFSLDVLTLEQSLYLLSDWAKQPVKSLPPEAYEIARECGYLPLALAMVGAFVRYNSETWASTLRILQQADLARLPRLFRGYKYPNLLIALDVSVQALPEEVRSRYFDLAVFPEEAVIPTAILTSFWASLGLHEDDSNYIIRILVNRSMVQRDENNTLRLHDLQYDYLRVAIGSNLPMLHRCFLLACACSLLDVSFEDLKGIPWQNLSSNVPYLWQHLVYHHIQAQDWDALYQLLTNFYFLETYCRTTSVFDLEADYRLTLAHWGGLEAQKCILSSFEEHLRQEVNHIAYSPEYLFSALYNHLTWLDAPEGPLHRLCEVARIGRQNWLRYRFKLCPEQPWLSLTSRKSINAIAVTLDERCFISCSANGTLKLWDLETGYLLHSFEEHTANVTTVAVVPNSRLAISGAGDTTLKIWDLDTGNRLRTLEGHKGAVSVVLVTADGCRALSASYDHTLRLWDLETGRCLRSIEGHIGSMYADAVTLMPNDRYAISADNRALKFWNLETGQLLRTLKIHTTVKAITVTPDGYFLLTGFQDGTIGVWDFGTGQFLYSIKGHAGSVNAIVVTSDGRYAISASGDSTVKVWNLQTYQLVDSFEKHTESVNAVAVTSNGQRGISGDSDGTIKVWNLKTAELLYSLQHQTWSLENNSRSRFQDGHTDFVNALAITRDGGRLVSGSRDRTIKLWNLETGSRHLVYSLEGHAGSVESVALTLDKHLIVSGSADRTVKLWEIESGRLLHSLEGHLKGVNVVTVSGDGRFIISGSNEGVVKVWEVESRRLIHSLEGHSDSVLALAVSPDGRFIISGSKDCTVKVWEIESGRMLHSLGGHTERVTAVAVSMDGNLLVSADCVLKVWEMESGLLLCTLEGHTKSVKDMVISPEGLIVSCSYDRTLRVWDLEAGQSHILFWNDAYILSLALSPDSCALACGDSVGRVWIFDWVR